MLTLALLTSTALADEGALAVAPFGVALFAWGHPGRGTIYASTQLAGIGGVVAGGIMATDAADAGDDEAYSTAQLVSGASVALATTSYLVSLIDGSRVAQLRAEGIARRDAVVQFDAAVARAPSRGERPGAEP
ncbi:MAG: hypothetical protein FJ102_12865 [Deltaproteobacteria bacterium]|nr:hypothetical protein [Deltaproteobacteria bacterium]